MIARERNLDKAGPVIRENLDIPGLNRIEGLLRYRLGGDLRCVDPGGHVSGDEARVDGNNLGALMGEFSANAVGQ